MELGFTIMKIPYKAVAIYSVVLLLPLSVICLWTRSFWRLDSFGWQDNAVSYPANGREYVRFHSYWVRTWRGIVVLSIINEEGSWGDSNYWSDGTPKHTRGFFFRSKMASFVPPPGYPFQGHDPTFFERHGLGFRQSHYPNSHDELGNYIKDFTFVVPMWLLLTLSLILLAPIARGWRKRRIRANWATTGRCPECGYDLRCSPERCPECGTPVNATTNPKES